MPSLSCCVGGPTRLRFFSPGCAEPWAPTRTVRAPRTAASRGVRTRLVTRRLLPFQRLPELNFVALWVHDPSELSVLGVVGLLEHVATLFAQCFEKRCEIFDSIVDHEGRLTRSEVL